MLFLDAMRLSHGGRLPMPSYAHETDSGVDLRAAIPKPIILWPLTPRVIPSAFAVDIPPGWEGQVRPRSSGMKRGLFAAGTIDAGYVGEIGIAVVLLRWWPMIIRPGERIAQLVFAPVEHARLREQRSLTGGARGTGGFGSTGTR